MRTCLSGSPHYATPEETHKPLQLLEQLHEQLLTVPAILHYWTLGNMRFENFCLLRSVKFLA
jgi:hypothetical protein